MGSKGFLLRMLPFLATFTLGIFIASFFVNIAAPRIGHGGQGKKYYKFKKLRMENERLRHENLRLRNELDSRQTGWHDPKHGDHIELHGEVFMNAPTRIETPRSGR